MVLLPASTPRSPRDGRFMLPTPTRRMQIEAQARAESPPPRIDDIPPEYAYHQRRLQHLGTLQAMEEAERREAAEAIAKQREVAESKKKKASIRPTRTRAQVVGMAGILSAASDCAAVLQGQLEPAAFAKRVSSMTPEAMEAWLGAFGACVGKLGGTLSGLTDQLQRQRGSNKQQRMMETALQVVERVNAFEEVVERVHKEVPAVVDEASKSVVHALSSSSDALCAAPIKRAKHWTKALTAALSATELEAKRLREAMARVGLATDSLAACSEAICAHACALLGCDDACLYVAVHPADGGDKEALYRLRAARPTEAEVALCSTQIHGADAVGVQASCMAARCLRAVGERTLYAPDGANDPRYSKDADTPAGGPQPASLLYVDMSDAAGALRAVVRVSHHADAPHAFPLGQGDAHKLEQLAPLFSLALRHAARAAAADPVAVQRALVMETLGATLSTVGEEAKAGELGGVMEAFGNQIAALLHADGCNMYFHDEPSQKLVQLPAVFGFQCTDDSDADSLL